MDCQSGSWKRPPQPRLYRYTFHNSTTWTVPANVKSAYVSLAGGGAGGVSWNAPVMISGSSGGFLVSYPVNLIPGEAIPIVIGAGGSVRTSHLGANGGASTAFGSYLLCTGGGATEITLSFADPGNCGVNGGVGLWGQYITNENANASGFITGGQTPFQFGSGGGAGRCDGCVVPTYAVGSPGSPGIVIVDVMY